MRLAFVVIFASLALLPALTATAGDVAAATTCSISQPRPFEVLQRSGTAPGQDHADIVIRGFLPRAIPGLTWEARHLSLGEAGDEPETPFAPAQVTLDGSSFTCTLAVPAGGWYRLELRGRSASGRLLTASVQPIGVGEVFLVAGQSYATNWNDEQLLVHDGRKRVAAFDLASGSWRIAHDPQPVVDGSKHGSIWPPLGDRLAKALGVPVAFANVAWGGTSSFQWMPGEPLHQRLIEAGRKLGDFRAVLWQQGESDVIAKTPTDTYQSNLEAIRTAAAKGWGFKRPWLLAKSTLHPTVYDDPAGEGRIRTAIDRLVTKPYFLRGPDTDTLDGEHRGDIHSLRHFTGAGQRAAATLWFESIQRELFDVETSGAATTCP